MKLTDIMLYGGAVIGGGGSSASGAKAIVFDIKRLAEYEKIEAIGGAMYKLTDDVPTYEELKGGYYALYSRVAGTENNYFGFLRSDGGDWFYFEENDLITVADAIWVVSDKAAQALGATGVTCSSGVYLIDPENVMAGLADSDCIHMIVWGL